MASRFVILHHVVAGGEHWDLMLEHGGVLLTWQLAREPIDAASLPIPAKRIADHRMAYLEYEGPISKGRGQVVRVDHGIVNYVRFTERCCSVELLGLRLSGRFCLVEEGGAWSLRTVEYRDTT
ncbi:MAG: hypothetical protein IH987_12530 [Planctomycetes bacterium]|nr:hypothetical protein [Planctomycetota bacterium]